MNRLLALPLTERLEAYRLLRDDLAEKARDTKADRLVDERREAGGAIRAVAQHLNLPPGQAPTTTQFREHASAVAPGWNVPRATRAWGRWRFACDAAMGRELPFSTKQAARRKKPVGDDLRYEEPLDALRLWLKSDPLGLTRQEYNSWAKQHNEMLPPGEPRVPQEAAVSSAFPEIGWESIVQVASGEIALDEAPKKKRRQKAEFDNTGLGLILSEEVLRLRREAGATAYPSVLREGGFPRPAIVKGKVRMWLRDEITAHIEGRPFANRVVNELGSDYLDIIEAAALVGLRRVQVGVNGTPRLPPSVAQIGTLTLWSRREAEEHYAAWQEEQSAVAARRRIREEAQ